MRILLLAGAALFLSGCNSSSKKDPNQAMDDTARMRDPNHIVIISTTRLTPAEIPSSMQVKGTVLEVYKWTDNLGENILATSYVAPYKDGGPDHEEDGKSAELHAYHYAGKDGEYKKIWVLDDTVRACPFDITAEFIPGSTTVTDMDKNGIAETKIQYAVACRSDVSPASMKLFMYENGKKYGLEGIRWIAVTPDMKFELNDSTLDYSKLPSKAEGIEPERGFGRYANETGFISAPASFLFYAKKEWLKYVKENISE